MKFTDFHDFGLKTLSNPYEFHYFSALGENNDFLDLFIKLRKIYENDKIPELKTWKSQKI